MTKNAATKNQRHPDTRSASLTVPKVRLYVERPEKQKNWLVNVGHVTDRGRWKTEPHAHPYYGQVIFIRSGRGMLNLEGSSVGFEAPCTLLLPTESVHGLHYEVDVDRWVVTIEVTYLAQINARLSEFIRLWASPRVIPLPSEVAVEFHNLIRKLAQEVESKTVGHVVATEAILTELLLMLLRGAHLEQSTSESATRSETRLADRFRELVDQHYRENWQLQRYASTLAVSLAQLRAACAAATGHSPTKMIHARLITEAKRSLIFGDMSMEQIAYWLGFSDAAYFTRFFRKQVGQSPSQFRVAARQLPHPAKYSPA